jgi:hypothetical protein
MLPHKHYSASEIEQVLQRQESPSAPLSDCGAEESTIHRWKREYPEELSALAAHLEILAKVSKSCLIPPLQRIYQALSILIRPPPNQSRLAWAYIMSKSHPVCVG